MYKTGRSGRVHGIISRVTFVKSFLTTLGSYIMDFVKKEWKAIAVVICLFGIIFYLSRVNGQLDTLKDQNAKLISTIDSIESVSISTDAGVLDIGKKVDTIDNNMSFVVQKLRRR
jgi:hypothetical protein